MTGRPGIHAFGHVPAAERGGIAFGQRLRAFHRALFERLVLRLTGGGFAAHRQRAAGLAALFVAETAAVLAHVVEAPQLAAFVGGVVAVDVRLTAAAFAADVHGRLGGLALADHRLQRQCRRRAFFQLEFLAQAVDLRGRQFLTLAAQQLLRQRDVAIAHALQWADLAALRFHSRRPSRLRLAERPGTFGDRCRRWRDLRTSRAVTARAAAQRSTSLSDKVSSLREHAPAEYSRRSERRSIIALASSRRG